MQVGLNEALGSIISVSIVLFNVSALLDLSVDIIVFPVVVVGYIRIDLFVDESNVEASILSVETELFEDTFKVFVDNWGIFKVPFLELFNSFSWNTQGAHTFFPVLQEIIPGFYSVLGRGL